MKAVEIITGPKDGETFTATTFLDYMRKSAPHWWQDGDISNECDWVFRGQWNANWKLVPSAARKAFREGDPFGSIINCLEKQVTATSSIWGDIDPISRDQILKYWAHSICIEHFLKLAQELNFKTEKPPTISLSIKEWIEQLETHGVLDAVLATGIGALMKTSQREFNFYENSSVALAQHHGVPTFLLDWSQNPVVACHFAANKPAKVEDSSDIAVWALNSKIFEKDMLPKTYFYPINKQIDVKGLYPPKSENQFLSSQSGILTYLDNPEPYWKDHGEYPDLQWVLEHYEIENLRKFHASYKWASEEASRESKILIDKFESLNQTLLRKIVLPHDQYIEFQLLLLREGISQAHMMPTLDNVAKTSLEYLMNKMSG